MAELLANNAASTLNGGITNVQTTLTVTNGAVFPATGDFRILIDSELMLCTARATNVLTVTRGIESTAGASHSNGAAVTHVLTKGGLDAYLASTWAWQSYTPVWTATGTAPSLGNGTLAGSFIQIGKLVAFTMQLSPGSTTTFGTGGWSFTVPVTQVQIPVLGGGGFLFDASANSIWTTVGQPTTSTKFNPLITGAAAAYVVSNTNPFTWATGDGLVFTGVLQAA